MNNFAIDLYQGVRKSCSGNILVSPVGVQLLLLMTYQGARGATAEQIAKILHLPRDSNGLLEAIKSITDILDDSLLKMAAEIFVDTTSKISIKFQNILRKNFLTEVYGVDFIRNPELSRILVNDWIFEKTNCKIKEILSNDFETSFSTFLLVSGVNFQADWKHKFKKNETTHMPFYIRPGSVVKTKMMQLKRKIFCFMDSKKLGAQILQLPCTKNIFRMIIILPKKLDGLADVESKLASMDLEEELSKLWLSKVDIYLPRFKLEKTINLNDILTEMGMPSAFSDKADFSGISSNQLAITQIIQKTVLEVEEEGNQLPGVTDFVSYYNSPLNVLNEIKCDHPFLFVLLVKNQVLMIGRLLNPEGI